MFRVDLLAKLCIVYKNSSVNMVQQMEEHIPGMVRLPAESFVVDGDSVR